MMKMIVYIMIMIDKGRKKFIVDIKCKKLLLGYLVSLEEVMVVEYN